MHPDVLTDKDCENVYELVYSSCRAVAAAAGEFLNVRLFRAEPPPPEPPRSRRGKARLPNTPLIRDLVQFFIESEVTERSMGSFILYKVGSTSNSITSLGSIVIDIKYEIFLSREYVYLFVNA